MVSPPSTCTLTRRSSGMTDNYNSQRYQDTYFSPFLPVNRPKESVYRTSFMDSSSTTYEPNKKSSTELSYVRTPMIQQPYAISNNNTAASCMRNEMI
uniref:Uncharacterized protein n=1 Tax=Panagrolaimus davidi TaxID=227884 RepID=A0A914PL42_9BILA